MVLQDIDASPQAPDPYNDYSNQDSYNPSARDNSGPLVPQLDYSQLPKPFRISRAQVEASVKDSLQRTAEALERPYSTDEANIMAYHIAKRLQTVSYATPAGVLGGLYRSYTLRNQLKLPFWRPDPEQFSLYKFPFTKLEGQPALYLWRAIQAASYTAMWTAWAKVFFVSYATYRLVSNIKGDGRLEDYRQALWEQAEKRANNQRTGQQAPQGQRQMQGQRQVQRSDASPQDTQWGSTQASQPSPENRRWGAEAGSRKASPSSNDFVFDDASPTAGNPPDEATPANAWERLRRGQAPGSSASQSSPGVNSETGSNSWASMRGREGIQQEQRAGSTGGDSFAFSRSDEERQLAKQEAQKDFDAKVERERRGQDFSEKGRWS